MPSWVRRTYIDPAVTNNDNNAFALETPSGDPGGKGGMFDDVNTGVAQNNGGEPLLNLQRGFLCGAAQGGIQRNPLLELSLEDCEVRLPRSDVPRGSADSSIGDPVGAMPMI